MARYERTDTGGRIFYECLPGHGDGDGPCGHQHMARARAEKCLYECIRQEAETANRQDLAEYGYNWAGWCVAEVHIGTPTIVARTWGTDEDGDTRRIKGEPHPGWRAWQGPC